MHKPGMGARKCGHCGARIEGSQLQVCPQCRSPLYGRFVPAPATQPPTEKKGSGLGVLFAFMGLGFLTIVGAGAFLLLRKKPDVTPLSSPQPTSAASGPVLADVPAGAASAAPSAIKKVAQVSTTPKPPDPKLPPPPPTFSARPLPVPSTTTSALALQPQRCNATISVGPFRKSRPTCSFNEKVSTGPTKLDFPCEGGAATATFATQTFRGSVTATSVSLSNIDDFTFGGCRVRSTQRILGARNASTGTYAYSRASCRGSCSGVTTCTATATVEFR
ncbi:MAG: hypothetical protein IPG50_34710 [Myxococcales bacterium]|nr:hypothetical protein [Myxococcales bacterium]